MTEQNTMPFVIENNIIYISLSHWGLHRIGSVIEFD
jgi:hypothetical protein